MLVIGSNSASTGYNLTRSLRFRSSATAYLNRTPASASNRRTWTWSGWFKRGSVGAGYLFGATSDSWNVNWTLIYFNSSNSLFVQDFATSQRFNLNPTMVFRDPSAWYHLVVAMDTTQATASDRIKIYVNGTQVTAFSTASYPSQNIDTFVDNTVSHQISGTGGYFDGYLAEVNFIDGQALTPSSFGSTNALTGVWQPARYTGTYGTNGFYLPFTDNSALTTASNVGLGKDFSGNANYWVTNNISVTAGVTYDSMTDVPTLTSATAANFAVGNPLYNDTTIASTWTNGNLAFSVGNAGSVQNTFGVTSGKWYWETIFSSNPQAVGVMQTGTVGRRTQAISYASDGSKYVNATNSAYGSAYTTSDVIGVALDMNGGTITFYKNNVSQGSIALSGATITIGSALIAGGGGSAAVGTFNFGQQPFTYTPPTNFVALNTYNLPTSTIVKGNTVMDATLYTGTGATQSITNAASFKPDLVWIKNRSAADDNQLVDSVRGVTLRLISNGTNAESANAAGLTAFNSNGFTIGSDANYNRSGSSLVGWQWQAGQGTTSSNTNGTITSTVSVNASAGFSVVTWTSPASGVPTIGHGLGVAPTFIIVKDRTSAYNWDVGCNSIGWANRLNLNTTNFAIAGYWNSTAPTSSVFTYTAAGANSGDLMVAYCWTPIAGFSAFGSYTGNGSADGPFVYTGFRPKFVLIKLSSAAGTNWEIWDSSRNTYNIADLLLLPSSSAAESTYGGNYPLDLLSNGFKVRGSGSGLNDSGATLIYAAFAENPTKYALAR